MKHIASRNAWRALPLTCIPDLLAPNSWRGIPPHPVQHANSFRYYES
jgi:hypothetical protein